MERKEVKEIVMQVLETSLELQLKAVRQIQGESDEPVIIKRKSGKRRQSFVDLSIKILTGGGKPMHVNDIVRHLLEDFGRVTDRDSISSALGKKAKQGILVQQAVPATFELLDKKGNQ